MYGLAESTPLVQLYIDGDVKSEQPTTQGTVLPLPKPLKQLAKYTTGPREHANYAFMWGAMSTAMLVLGIQTLRKGL